MIEKQGNKGNFNKRKLCNVIKELIGKYVIKRTWNGEVTLKFVLYYHERSIDIFTFLLLSVCLVWVLLCLAPLSTTFQPYRGGQFN